MPQTFINIEIVNCEKNSCFIKYYFHLDYSLEVSFAVR